ncbi:NAC domain-containing protein 83-like isoform X2 [Cucurbita maxima]|uniref:NAC domain-containing protein 83-like isoform X2 n=1 Tax=Cucurbita maxima TaxID=3661 RepID=A0A6J1J786_CUCMA|nr:NAC domain-containing protein 83-like isoform X2 [Cucurbita maxima]
MFPMENTSNFVFDGGIRLPVGYRFCPTDEELVEHYLKRKVFGLPLPASVIPEFNVFLTDPWGLPGDSKEKRFFFSQQKSFLRMNAGCGIWKSIGKEKFILSQGINQLFGLRKSLVFSESKFPERTRTTRWVMHEYRLARSAATSNSTQIEVGDWAVYCLFQKRRKHKRKGVEENQRVAVAQASILDLTVEDGWEFPQPCASCSSGVTQVSSNGTGSTDQEETSGGLGLDLGFS